MYYSNTREPKEWLMEGEIVEFLSPHSKTSKRNMCAEHIMDCKNRPKSITLMIRRCVMMSLLIVYEKY